MFNRNTLPTNPLTSPLFCQKEKKELNMSVSNQDWEQEWFPRGRTKNERLRAVMSVVIYVGKVAVNR